MPVQLAQCPRIEVENDAGDRLRNREPAGIDAPLAAPFEHTVRRLGKQRELVRLRWKFDTLERRRLLVGRRRSAGEVDLLFWESFKR